MSADTELNILMEEMWKGGTPQDDHVAFLRNKASALAGDLHDPAIAARVTDALTLLSNNQAWETRLEPFRSRTKTLLTRNRQIDQLGDPGTKVEAIFDILNGDLDTLDGSALDLAKLRTARTGRVHAKAATKLLQTLGLSTFNADAAADLMAVAGTVVDRGNRFGCHAMFADESGRGHVLGVTVAAGKGNGIGTANKADEEMGRQAESVLSGLFDGAGAYWALEWDVSFGGNSIGLPMWIAGKVELDDWTRDPLVAATGRVRPDGTILSVGHIGAKVSAAVRHGFRRIIVPQDNLPEAAQALEELNADAGQLGSGDSLVWCDPDVKLIGVRTVDDVRAALDRVDTSAALSRYGMVRLLVKCLPRYGLDLTAEEEVEDRYRLRVADAKSTATIDLLTDSGATPVAGGAGSARQAVDLLLADQLPAARIQPRPHLTAVVATEERQALLAELIDRVGAVERDTSKNEYQVYRFELTDSGSKAFVDAYTSKKVVVHGKAPAWDRLASLVEEVLRGLSGHDELVAEIAAAQAEAETETAATPADSPKTPVVPADGSFVPHIGADEAGKGDYFGPLVCAACYVEEESAKKLDAAGVRDSKKLSDAKVLRLAEEIKELIRGRWSIVAINPERYNSLAVEMRAEKRNLNSLVAWGHASAIRQLEDHGIFAPYALVDKFADESFFDQRASGARKTQLELRTKAESDVAVAAASILARARFLTWIAETSEELGIKVPKGAGPPVVEAAKALVAEHGPEVLDKYTKVSFKTTQTVLGT